ncbi:YjcZ family sporulation protein [Pseudoneobacillus rhizosphaerae]|nr:YjcZ family sporulation protein [Pseudoneobacillus rhizosphaerae]
MPLPIQPSCYPEPAFCYAAPVNRCNDFVLIVVLFILLIIVGATLCVCID